MIQETSVARLSDASGLSRRAKRPALTRADYDRYRPLVERIASRLARRLPPNIGVNDLVAWGWVGFIEVYGRSGGLPEEQLEAYATLRVRGAMLDFLRGLDPVTRHARSASRRVAQASAKVSRSLGRPPLEAEVAAELGVTEAAYRATLDVLAISASARHDVADLDPPDSQASPPDEQAGRTLMIASIERAADELSPRLRRVMSLYYQEEKTLREIGVLLGVTESRVSQMHTEAILRVRASLGAS